MILVRRYFDSWLVFRFTTIGSPKGTRDGLSSLELLFSWGAGLVGAVSGKKKGTTAPAAMATTASTLIRIHCFPPVEAEAVSADLAMSRCSVNRLLVDASGW